MKLALALCAYAVFSWSPLLAQDKLSKEEIAALSVPPERVFDMLEVQGVLDELDPAIWVSSQPFATKKFADDRFLRANINKATGVVFYQLYMQTRAPQSAGLRRMTYLVGGDLKTADVQRISIDIDCDRYGCTHYEDYVVYVPREHLQALASEASQGFWRARVFGRTVEGLDLQFLANETSGFLMAVDRVLATLPAKPAQ